MELSCDQVIVSNAYVAELPNGDESLLVVSGDKITNVISAISAGKNAAAAIDRMIRGEEATVAAVSSGYAADVEKLQAALSALAEESPEQMLVLGARQFAPVQDDQLDPQRRLLTLES